MTDTEVRSLSPSDMNPSHILATNFSAVILKRQAGKARGLCYPRAMFLCITEAVQRFRQSEKVGLGTKGNLILRLRNGQRQTAVEQQQSAHLALACRTHVLHVEEPSQVERKATPFSSRCKTRDTMRMRIIKYNTHAHRRLSTSRALSNAHAHCKI